MNILLVSKYSSDSLETKLEKIKGNFLARLEIIRRRKGKSEKVLADMFLRISFLLFLKFTTVLNVDHT
jgi:hypothetical protein